MIKQLLFHREFLEYTGGHGKVYDYFRHACAHPDWRAVIHLTATSVCEQNPWLALREHLAPSYQPQEAAALFIAGMDWATYPCDIPGKPVINLVQHVRHATTGHPLRQYLNRPAIRICVSQAVADAIASTRCVRGPVYVIEAALDIDSAVTDRKKQTASIFIDAIKQPALGRAIANGLAGTPSVSLLTQRIPRTDYLARLAEADIAVLLPHPAEGFYLPALEAMALGCAVVVPDCIGNRAYARDGTNVLMPPLDAMSILLAIGELLNDPHQRESLRTNGVRTSGAFTQRNERSAFHRLLEDIDSLWSSI
ncbi:hypothetical protein CNR27_14775 [Luteimonas chenhongjianii]|uniref:Glycosyl transferase family 1 domain-containing protein n=1 Tax=Luteimonas chenhongjianii TaxID=2006110 RepID=A0A290XHJ8_9GAMM|nr:glycosyltransferase [Luteimonas chenhongjianii]ATD68541.1 hypothetical protein CNR27_14775 [Luteimonas chenhongjianii]